MQAYERAVTRAMLREYGVTWLDACGDVGPLRAAMEAGRTAEQFVRWWGEKYGMTPVSDL